jgi:hypothetical protein
MLRAHTYPFDTVDNPNADPGRPFPHKDAHLGELLASKLAQTDVDMVNSPPHYTQHPSGVECIEITEHMNFCLGNAVKYIWRAGLKSSSPIQDLEKAIFYLDREISRIRSTQK